MRPESDRDLARNRAACFEPATKLQRLDREGRRNRIHMRRKRAIPAPECPPAVDSRVAARKLELSQLAGFMGSGFAVQWNGLHSHQTNAKQLRIHDRARKVGRNVAQQERDAADSLPKCRSAIFATEECHEPLE